MADQVVATVISIGFKLKQLYDTVKDNKDEAGRLASRLRVFEPCLTGLQTAPVAETQGALDRLVAVLDEGTALCSTYNETGWWRGAERWANAGGYQSQFASRNARISTIAQDLTTVSSVKSLLIVSSPEQRRTEDLADAQVAIEKMVRNLLEECAHNNEATTEEMHSMQAEIADN